MPFSELPRPLLVRSILRELGRSSDILQRGQTGLELTASRVADAVEAAVDIFAGFDDPQPMHSAILDRTFEGLEEIRAAAGAPSSPEDLDQPAKVLDAPRNPMKFPQPVRNSSGEEKPAPSLIVLPGTREAERVMHDREITPIRPRRITGPEAQEGEAASWEWGELYSAVTLRMEDSLRVRPPGVAEEIQLDRVVSANQSTGIIKVAYSVSGQKESTPTAYGSSEEIPMSIPVEVGHSFSVYDPRSLNFADITAELRDRAAVAFRPRQKGIVSTTRITSDSLESMFAAVQRSAAKAALAPADAAVAGGNVDFV